VYITKTAKERIANTLVWYPSHVVMPKTSSADAATAAARDLIYALQNPHPAAPIAPLADDHRKDCITWRKFSNKSPHTPSQLRGCVSPTTNQIYPPLQDL
jgi:hypothetical protein